MPLRIHPKLDKKQLIDHNKVFKMVLISSNGCCLLEESFRSGAFRSAPDLTG